MHKKIVPAVWFQNKLNPAVTMTRKPEVLELLESQLAQVTGGALSRSPVAAADTCSNCVADDCAPD